MELGEVRRAYLGVSMQEVSTVDAELYGLPRTMGALVQSTVGGSPAAAAGLQQEDVIVGIDGVDIERPSQLQLLIAQRRPGEDVAVGFFRDGERREVDVQLGTAPLGPQTVEAAAPTVSSQSLIGIDVMPLDEATAEQLGYDAPGGVVIGGVTPGGPASRARVGRGQKLLDVNREPVETVQDVEELLGDLQPGDIVSLQLGSANGGSNIVNLRVPQ